MGCANKVGHRLLVVSPSLASWKLQCSNHSRPCEVAPRSGALLRVPHCVLVLNCVQMRQVRSFFFKNGLRTVIHAQ